MTSAVSATAIHAIAAPQEKPTYTNVHLEAKLDDMLSKWVPGAVMPKSELPPKGDVADLLGAVYDATKNQDWALVHCMLKSKWQEYLSGWFKKILEKASNDFAEAEQDYNLWVGQASDFAKKAHFTDPQEELAAFIGKNLSDRSLALAEKLFKPSAVTINFGLTDQARTALLGLGSITELSLIGCKETDGLADFFSKLSLKKLTVEDRDRVGALNLTGIEKSPIESLTLRVNKVAPFNPPPTVTALTAGFDIDGDAIAHTIGSMKGLHTLNIITERQGLKYGHYVELPSANMSHLGQAVRLLPSLTNFKADTLEIVQLRAANMPDSQLFDNRSASLPQAGSMGMDKGPLNKVGEHFVSRFGTLDWRRNSDDLHKLTCILELMYKMGWWDPTYFQPHTVALFQEWLETGIGSDNPRMVMLLAILAENSASDFETFVGMDTIADNIIAKLGKNDPKPFFQAIRERISALESRSEKFKSVVSPWLTKQLLFAISDANLSYSIAEAFRNQFALPKIISSWFVNEKNGVDKYVRIVKACQCFPMLDFGNEYMVKRRATELYFSQLPQCVLGTLDNSDPRFNNLVPLVDPREAQFSIPSLSKELASALLKAPEAGFINLVKTIETFASFETVWPQQSVQKLVSTILVLTAPSLPDEYLTVAMAKLLPDSIIAPSEQVHYDLDVIVRLTTLRQLDVKLGIHQWAYNALIKDTSQQTTCAIK